MHEKMDEWVREWMNETNEWEWMTDWTNDRLINSMNAKMKRGKKGKNKQMSDCMNEWLQKVNDLVSVSIVFIPSLL